MTELIMTKKELKKLSRAELLELLLIQTKEVEKLQEELEETKQLLEDKRIRVEKAGNLAEAVLQVNEVMNAAQNAAKQYLENVIEMEKETKQQCIRLLNVAEEESKKIVSGAYDVREGSGNSLKKNRNPEEFLKEELLKTELLRKKILKERILKEALEQEAPGQGAEQELQNDSDKEVNKNIDEVQEI